jgi:putative transposase
MLGSQIPHLKKKYKNIRKRLQSQKRFRELKNVNRREHFKTLDIIRKVSKKIVLEAKRCHLGIKMEDLKGIRKSYTKKYRKEANHTLNSWPFFTIRQCLTNKAIEHGVEILFIDPQYTSQRCAKCGHVSKENRSGKLFECTFCAHVDHADINAAFNIALKSEIDLKASLKKGAMKTRRGRKTKESFVALKHQSS